MNVWFAVKQHGKTLTNHLFILIPKANFHLGTFLKSFFLFFIFFFFESTAAFCTHHLRNQFAMEKKEAYQKSNFPYSWMSRTESSLGRRVRWKEVIVVVKGRKVVTSRQIRAEMFFAHTQSFFSTVLKFLSARLCDTGKTKNGKKQNHYLARSVWLISLKHNNNGKEVGAKWRTSKLRSHFATCAHIYDALCCRASYFLHLAYTSKLCALRVSHILYDRCTLI